MQMWLTKVHKPMYFMQMWLTKEGPMYLLFFFGEGFKAGNANQEI